MQSIQTLRRYSASIVFSALLTSALLIVMRHAVQNHNDVPEAVPGANLDIVTPLEDEAIQATSRIRKEPPPPPEVPPRPQIQLAANTEVESVGTAVAPTVDPIVDIRPGESPADGDLINVVRVAPNYPRGPQAKGIDGWVVVEFDVDAMGRVIEPRILSADPPRVFNRAALDAVKRYKYKPLVVNGRAHFVENVRTRIVFELTRA